MTHRISKGRLRSLLVASALVLAAGPAFADICGKVGGDLVLGMEAKLGTLDQHVNAANATRNVAMNIFETLMTRDDKMAPILDLADSLDVSDDKLTYTFTLRSGVKFHNGKPLTSADVAASFDRYSRIGVDRSALGSVDHWETPDDATFKIFLKEPQASFLESISASTVPIVIIPSEQANAEATRLEVIGTGPFQLDEFVADSHVKLKRYEDYKPNETLDGLSGFAGRKQACVDTVTFRTLAEPGARLAALETGEVDIVEDVPTLSTERIAGNKDIVQTQLKHAALWLTYPNLSEPPTDNLKVRQAIQAALNLDEIMDAMSDGSYSLNPSFQFPGQTYYSEAGSQYYNRNDPEAAKALLKEAGYNGEPIRLLTTRDIPRLYTAALVMSEQMKAVGMNAELVVLDWPTALGMSVNETKGWNFFYTGWITVTAQGGAQSLRNLADPSNVHKPKDNKSDAEFMKQFEILSNSPDLEERKAAFAKAQERVFEQVMAIPFGVTPKNQATRANVKGYVPFFNTRVSNVWLEN